MSNEAIGRLVIPIDTGGFLIALLMTGAVLIFAAAILVLCNVSLFWFW